jgi:hypothetical protein
MDFLRHRKGGYGLLSGVPHFFFTVYCRNCNKLRECEEIEISRQSCRGECEGKPLRLLSGFRPRIQPLERLEPAFLFVGSMCVLFYEMDRDTQRIDQRD